MQAGWDLMVAPLDEAVLLCSFIEHDFGLNCRRRASSKLHDTRLHAGWLELGGGTFG